jgi:ParB-like chromosome segregation protein Spo0J
MEWVDPSTLFANDYNPNQVFPPEMALLKMSLLSDGWTQPIVARRDGEIVDGFHRWTLGSRDADVRAMTDGFVPVVRLRDGLSLAEQQMATIRHNRARGEHAVLKMSAIVRNLIDAHHLTPAAVAATLGMEDEEVDRLYDRSGMTERGTNGDEFNTAWTPA